MEIYHYRAGTREFAGVSNAVPSPLEPGQYLIPANATAIAPPPPGERQAAVFDPVTETWTRVPDWRGVTLYARADGVALEIAALSDTPGDHPGHTLEAPPPVEEGQRAVFRGGAWAVEDIPPLVPESVSMRQARLALLAAGLLDTVDAAIAAMEGAAGQAARIAWEYATEISRANPLFAALTAQLGLTAEHLDALFITAATL